ncbi:MAG: transketolase [Candidatus Manganitrophus sp.]|nr:transketolase [Candidatus Manganitrophus sp.]
MKKRCALWSIIALTWEMLSDTLSPAYGKRNDRTASKESHAPSARHSGDDHRRRLRTPRGSLSAADLITALYFKLLRHKPSDPEWADRDRFILSKGHGAPALYAALARTGYFPVEALKTLRKLGSPLQGHPEKGKLAGVEASTGSLGQGVSIGAGMALAGRLDRKDYRVYVLMGDGEANEGQVWEAAMFAAHYKIDHLTVILDCNRQQLDGWTTEILDIEPLADKWRAFGWHVIDFDGHDFGQILNAFDEARRTVGKPTLLLARTIKGKGVSFMENNLEFHGVAPTTDQLQASLKELDR